MILCFELKRDEVSGRGIDRQSFKQRCRHRFRQGRLLTQFQAGAITDDTSSGRGVNRHSFRLGTFTDDTVKAGA